VFRQWNNGSTMLDLNALRVFDRVAALRNFSRAGKSLGLSKSSVSRTIVRLEDQLGTRLLQRTTRQVVLTPTGTALHERCKDLLGRVNETEDYISSLTGKPRGLLRLSAGIGFGIKVLAELLPAFMTRFPELTVSLDLTSRLGSPLTDGIDVAIQLGPMPNSDLRCVSLGSMKRYLCAAPAYLDRRGAPRRIGEVSNHDTIEMPRGDGRPRHWTFVKNDETKDIVIQPRIVVNEALTIHRLVLNGAGLGIISGYLCRPEIAAGRLVHLFPQWFAQPIDVNMVYPSNKEIAPAPRAFIDYMKEATKHGAAWLDEG
jgi:LysR family transcriptional regulator, regulator for bpeEF and oprC